MAIAEAEIPAPLKAAPVIGVVGVALGGDPPSGDCGAQAVSINTATITIEKKIFFMFHSPVRYKGRMERI
jgi:hypothetical protein